MRRYTPLQHNDDNTTPTDYNTNSFPVNDVNYDAQDSWDEVSDSDPVEHSSLESIIASFCSVSECTTDHVIDLECNVFHISIDDADMEASVAKAKKFITKKTRAVLSASFNEAIRDEIDGGIADKTLRWISEEEKLAKGYVEYHLSYS